MTDEERNQFDESWGHNYKGNIIDTLIFIGIPEETIRAAIINMIENRKIALEETKLQLQTEIDKVDTIMDRPIEGVVKPLITK